MYDHLRSQYHAILLSYYQSRGAIPKGFVMDFHTRSTDRTLITKIDRTLRKCSKKLMTVFKGHYKQQLKSLAREEKELINGLKRYYPEQADNNVEEIRQEKR